MVAELISVEKRKWDGSISSRERAWLVDCDASPLAWRVSAGTRRERPAQGDSELVEQDELWLSLPDAPVVLCSYLTPENTLERHELHAAWEPVGLNTGVLRWIDLDLDVVVERPDRRAPRRAGLHGQRSHDALPGACGQERVGRDCRGHGEGHQRRLAVRRLPGRTGARGARRERRRLSVRDAPRDPGRRCDRRPDRRGVGARRRRCRSADATRDARGLLG